MLCLNLLILLFQDFRVESESKLPEVDKLRKLISELTSEVAARDTVDALHSRWVAVDSAARQRANKMDKLVLAWREMDATIKQIEDWLQQPQFAAILNNEPPIQGSLDKQLAQMKVTMKTE